MFEAGDNLTAATAIYSYITYLSHSLLAIMHCAGVKFFGNPMGLIGIAWMEPTAIYAATDWMESPAGSSIEMMMDFFFFGPFASWNLELLPTS